jgi:hypothetical protein
MVEAKRGCKSRANEATSNVIPFAFARGVATILQSRQGIEEVSLESNLVVIAQDKNVVSLASARMEHDWKKMAYAAGSVEIDFKGIELEKSS